MPSIKISLADFFLQLMQEALGGFCFMVGIFLAYASIIAPKQIGTTWAGASLLLLLAGIVALPSTNALFYSYSKKILPNWLRWILFVVLIILALLSLLMIASPMIIN